jgi:hypothetical protein
MASDQPEGFYSRYLRQLGERRAAEGKPPAEDIAPAEYWQRRRELEELKQENRVMRRDNNHGQ